MTAESITLPLLAKLRTIGRSGSKNARAAKNLARWHGDAFTMGHRARRAAWIEAAESVIKADGYLSV